jgi:N-acetylglutamate synthase-like GNAT family acetyltransferase
MFQIEIIPKANLDTIIPLLEILNPKTSREILIERLTEIKDTNYQCVGVYDQAKLIAISGIWILNKFYAGKHIEPDNVIVHPDYRNKGIGEILLKWIHQYANEIGCLTSELNSRVTNDAGNKFWKRMGYEIAGYHFIKPLKNSNGNNNNINSCLSGHQD